MAIVGDLVANLTANAAPFVAAMGTASTAVRGLQRTVSGIGSAVGVGLSAVGSVAAGAGLAVAGLGVALGAAGIKGVSAFRESEQAGKKLDAVLAATGGAAGVSGEEIRQLAGDLQSLTNFEDDATIGAAGVLATFTQIRGDTFKSAIVAAQDLSSVMGQDLNSSIVQVGKALNDPIRGVSALSRVGVSFSQQQKDQIKQLQESGDLAGAQSIILAELQREFGGAAQAMADPFTVLSNIIGDIMEQLGGAITPALQHIANEILVGLRDNSEAIGVFFTAMGSALMSFVVPATRAVATGFRAIVVAVENVSTVGELLRLRMLYSLNQMGGVASHFFTVELPAYFDWFLANWSNIWTTAADFVGTAFVNIGTNVRSAFESIWEYIASGGESTLEMAWTPLTEGLRNTIGELPDVAERIPSAVEEGLQRRITDLQDGLRQQIAGAVVGGTEDAVGPVFQGLAAKAKNITDQTEKAVAMTETRGVSALQAGSGEALSAILGAMRRESDQKEMLRLKQEQVELQREQLQATRDANDNDETVSIQ